MEFPNSKQLISKILIDWAKCKIESDKPDDILVKTIQERLLSEDQSQVVSFTEIA